MAKLRVDANALVEEIRTEDNKLANMRNESSDNIGLQHLLVATAPKKEGGAHGKKHNQHSKFGEADEALPHTLFEGSGNSKPDNKDYKGFLV